MLRIAGAVVFVVDLVAFLGLLRSYLVRRKMKEIP